jgi:uncharacterized protein (DUF2236 family)
LVPGGGAVTAGVSISLFQRAAAAFAANVPEQPADDGYFGPRSVTWRVAADLSAPVALLRALLLQALHPLAMAGVDQHSDWRADPGARFASTAAYGVATTYGDKTTARAAAARVRKIHETVRGTDPVTGLPYDANDPALLLWVHAALVESGLAACRLYGAPLTAADADRYVAEMTAVAELIGVPAGMAPASVGSLDAYFDGVRPSLASSPATADTATYLLGMPDIEPELSDVWQVLATASIAALPAWARELHGFGDVVAPERELVRQVLGVLDVVYLGEPGVLEARQRLTLRMRAAQDQQGGR